MSESSAVMAFVQDLFAGMGAIEARRMFGGVGLLADGIMFGLIDQGQVFLKTDVTLRRELAEAGGRSWIYAERKGPKAGVEQQTSYWSLPDSASDDPEEACAWGRRALAVASAIKSAGPRKRAPAKGKGRAKSG